MFTFLLKRRQFLAIDIQEKIDLANLPFFKALVMGSDWFTLGSEVASYTQLCCF